ncbi:universal stress protein [Mycolicibacterium sp.]|uniref:universal stress protein n=1 Tax=Mycolicibacterium sp. TaxID=2320850 RepID=UPI0028AFE258|nr:universal stress protein [Mycolicibacterium sp.]
MTVEIPEPGVVVGADGSEHGIAALRWAAATAVAYGLPLTVLHARPDAIAEPTLLAEPDGVLGDAVAVARAEYPGLQTRALQMPDAPVQSLLAAGEEADIVVIGSRGIEGFRGLLLGSTTMHVAPYAQCPVVVVHSALEGGVLFEASDGYPGNPGQVVLGYDGSPAANRAAAFAFRHAEAIGCGVVAVTVEAGRGDPEAEPIDPENATPGSDTSAFHSPVIVTASSFPDVPVSFVAGYGRPAEVLLTQAISAELLVVGSRGSGGFAGLIMGSVSQKVLAHASCPVAVLHPGIPAETASGMA